MHPALLQVYGRYVDGRGLRLEGLQKAYDDGAGDLERDYAIVSQWQRSGGQATGPPPQRQNVRQSTYQPPTQLSPRAMSVPGGFTLEEKVAIMFKCFDRDGDGR
jgi:hypothetical protein